MLEGCGGFWRWLEISSLFLGCGGGLGVFCRMQGFPDFGSSGFAGLLIDSIGCVWGGVRKSGGEVSAILGLKVLKAS